jgi:branched-chain amino acid transport system permease protein
VVGWLSFYHGSTPLYASVISLVFPIVVTQLIYSGGLLTGSSSGLVGYDTLPLELEGFFRLSGLVMVAVTLAAWVFVRSDAGKLLVAVRDNDVRCAYLGISPKRIQIILTIALAGVAGFTGFLFAHVWRGGTREHRLSVRHPARNLGGAWRSGVFAWRGVCGTCNRLSQRKSVR